MARLRRSDCNGPGIARRRRGRGFSYHWPDGSSVQEADILERIMALAIPPAWEDVWICPWANGHLQATGMDKAGRRQYLYHDGWRQKRDAEKFERIREFGKALPHLRETVEHDLRRKGLGKRRVVAAAVRMLDIGYFRVGGEQYAEENDTYGVATLLKQHVHRQGGALVFDYDAKGGQRRVISIEDRQLLPVIARLKRRRSGGDRLLAWKRKDGWVDVTSNDVNDYIKRAAGEDFSAKDFRTWSATVMAAVGFAGGAEEASPGARAKSGRATRRRINEVVRDVAEAIGDTPAVCRSSYIDPAVVDRFEQGRTVGRALAGVANRDEGNLDAEARHGIERAVLGLLSR
ncbi:MAG TPA: hypothetical protein VFJ79_06620 [Acidimicrobiales bacterium]|nr:hypothetical protein [Acidimicrobiales bacterium]